MTNKLKGIIVAGNTLQYIEYLQQYNLNKTDFPLVMSIEKIHGYKDIPALSVGTYYQLKDFSAMREYVETHNMMGGLEALGIEELND